MTTVLLDNYDSFTFNLYQYIAELSEPPLVFRNRGLDLLKLQSLNPDRIVISPGPGRPENPEYFGICLDAIRVLGPRIPVLGVCLGHQGIFYAYGGSIVPAPKAMHGKTAMIRHLGDALFAGVPETFEAMLYHSLVADAATTPECLVVTAEADGVIMAIRHREFPVFGVQFHPESIGTPFGKIVLSNFLRHGRET